MRYSYKKALDQLIAYATKEGYANVDISYDNVSRIQWSRTSLNEPKAIKIEGCYTFEYKTYIMLHELGHHELRKNWNKFEKRFPVMAFAEHKMTHKNEKKYTRRISYIVSSLEEEFMAWDEGFKLAERLGIKINMTKWTGFKSKCLKSYIQYYATLKK